MRIQKRQVFVVLMALLSVGAAHASTITYQQVNITGPVFGFSFNNDAFAAGNSAFPPGYSFSGEFCEDAFCSTPSGAPANSLLRLTNMNLTCNTGTGVPCAPIDITFEALGATAGGLPVPATPVLVNLSLQGSGQASGFARICIATSSSFCASDLSGPQSFSFGFNQFIFGSAAGATVAPQGFDVYGVFHVNGLADGASIFLGNSLDTTITFVPEPSTFALLGVGMSLLGFVAKRRRVR